MLSKINIEALSDVNVMIELKKGNQIEIDKQIAQDLMSAGLVKIATIKKQSKKKNENGSNTSTK